MPRVFCFYRQGRRGKNLAGLRCGGAVGGAGSARCWSVPTRPPMWGRCLACPSATRSRPSPRCPAYGRWRLTPGAAAQGYRDRIVGPVRGVLPDDVVKGIEEQLSGACTTEIAAFDEFTALLTDGSLDALRPHPVRHRAHGPHHPAAVAAGRVERFFRGRKGDASCLGPLAGLEKQRSQYQGRSGRVGRW